MRTPARRIVLFASAAAAVAGLMIADRVQDHHGVGAAVDPSPVAPTSASVAPSPAGATSPVAPTTTSPTPTVTPEPNGEHHEPAVGPVLTVASGYLRLFFDKHATDSQWHAGLAKLSTPSHAATVASVPRTAVPAAAVGSVSVIRLGATAATVRAALSDTTVVDVGLVLDETGWKVSRVVPYTPVVTR